MFYTLTLMNTKKNTKQKEKNNKHIYITHTQLHTDKHTPLHFSLFT